MSRNTIFVLIYHRHKLLDLINIVKLISFFISFVLIEPPFYIKLLSKFINILKIVPHTKYIPN
jgi:hypothetical protein